jgi:outer membrane receptor protein involved in Fe transport
MSKAHHLLAGLLATTALSVPALAFAEETPDAVDAVIVVGQREAQRAAIAVKRETFVVADVVSADDIGKLPDHNTAAALRRIPGISVMEDQGEPRFPVIRGLRSTYNRTTIDGALVASVDESGRTVPMDIVPSVMAGRLEVIKTVTPENDGNAIGGVINVTTRSAFDAGQPFFNGMASYGDYERSGGVRNDKPSYRLAFATGTTFGANDQWGVVIGASHEQLDYDIPQVEAQTPRCANTPPPARRCCRARRPATASRCRPTASPVLVQQHQAAQRRERQDRVPPHRRLPLGGLGPVRPHGGRRGADRVPHRADRQRHQPDPDQRRLRARPRHHPAEPADHQARDRPGPHQLRLAVRPAWKADGDLVYSQAGLEVPNQSVEFRTVDAAGANYAFTYDTTNPLFPVFTPVNNAALRNPANYVLQQHRVALTDRREDQPGPLQPRLRRRGGDRNLKAKIGGLLRTSERDFKSSQVNYRAGPASPTPWTRSTCPGPSELIAGRYLLSPRIGAKEAMDFFRPTAPSSPKPSPRRPATMASPKTSMPATPRPATSSAT